MKRIITTLGFVCAILALNAQITVVSIEQISDNGVRPQFSPKGDYVLLSDMGKSGLFKFDISKKQATQITDDANAGSDAIISDGGTTVVYHREEFKNHLRYSSVRSINLNTGDEREVDAASRDRHAMAFAGGKVKVAKRTSMRSLRLLTDTRTVEHEYVLAVEDDCLVLYDGTKRYTLNPSGSEGYIWQSISPDQKHIVYMALNNLHTYVCDMNGKNRVDLGYIAAPTWFGNDWIVGMQDQDDGHRTTKSELVAIRTNGKDFQKLPTPNQKIAINPTANSATNSIVFENDGKIYLMKVKIK